MVASTSVACATTDKGLHLEVFGRDLLATPKFKVEGATRSLPSSFLHLHLLPALPLRGPSVDVSYLTGVRAWMSSVGRTLGHK